MKTSINLEITKICNAKCITCPREKIKECGDIKIDTFKLFLSRLYQARGQVSMVNLSGYGETLMHKKFFEIIGLIKEFNLNLSNNKEKPIKFCIVTNAQAITKKNLEAIDSVINRLKISFASISPKNYKKIHIGLDYEKVRSNIELAITTLKNTKIVLHLTPTKFTMEDIEPTVNFWRSKGIKEIVLFPFTFNRAGNLQVKNTHLDIDEKRNLKLARKLRLKQLEEVFIPKLSDLLRAFLGRPICLTRLAALYIDYKGNYHYCINDISSQMVLGNLKRISIQQARDKIKQLESLECCNQCNMQEGISKSSLTKVIMNSLLSTKA